MRTLRVIAVFRLLKAALLIAAGFGVFHLRQLAQVVPYAAVHRFATELLRIPPLPLALAAFAYAALFIAEGVGLWMDKRWAEWLTLIATASFIPFEVVELVKKATLLRGGVLAINVAILIYLALRRWKDRGKKRRKN